MGSPQFIFPLWVIPLKLVILLSMIQPFLISILPLWESPLLTIIMILPLVTPQAFQGK